jgi:hypothetical protein
MTAAGQAHATVRTSRVSAQGRRAIYKTGSRPEGGHVFLALLPMTCRGQSSINWITAEIQGWSTRAAIGHHALSILACLGGGQAFGVDHPTNVRATCWLYKQARRLRLPKEQTHQRWWKYQKAGNTGQASPWDVMMPAGIAVR